MMKPWTAKTLTIINFLIVLYFVILYIINVYEVDFVFIGIFGELLTIPFLLAEVAFVVFGIRYLVKHEKEVLNMVSLLLLIVCAVLTIGSLF